MRACIAVLLASCSAVPPGTLHVRLHDDPPPAAVIDAARAFEQRLRGHPVAGDDVMPGNSLDVGPVAFVSYRNRHVLDGGDSWCWLARGRADCTASGPFALARGLHLLGTARPVDAELAVLVAALVSGTRPRDARVERAHDETRVSYAIDRYDEATSKRARVEVLVRLTRAGDVVVAEGNAPAGEPAGPTALSFEGHRIGDGYVTPPTIAPLRAQSDAFARCFGDAADPYPFIGLDVALDANGRVEVLAASGTRASLDATACVADLVRATHFGPDADREGTLAISRHAP